VHQKLKSNSITALAFYSTDSAITSLRRILSHNYDEASLEEFMKIAIIRAKTSLKRGNKGLGRRLVKIAEN